jgi:hypothetical protein
MRGGMMAVVEKEEGKMGENHASLEYAASASK